MALARQQTTPVDNLDMLISFNVKEVKTLIAQSLKRVSGFAHIKADNRDPAAPPPAATNNREQLQIPHVLGIMDSPAGFLRAAHLNPNDMFMASCTTPTRNQNLNIGISADDAGDLHTKEHRTVTPEIIQRELQRLVVTGQADKYLATSTLTIHTRNTNK